MIFKRDPGLSAKELARDGYVVLRDIFTPEFRAYLTDFAGKSRQGDVAEYGRGRIAGKKQQYLFSFPDEAAGLEFRAGIARLTGIAEDKVTISERHLKQYDETAAAYPAPHKDRGASQFSAGIPVFLGEETSVCVFPGLDRSANRSETAVFLTRDTYPGIDTIYASVAPKLLQEKIGDLVVFEGSTLFHERIKPAGTSVLYIKFNGEGLDPLGENIYATEKTAAKAA